MEKIRKIKYSVIVKVIATMVLTISIVGFFAASVMSLFYTEVGKSEGMLKEINKKVAEAYSYAFITELTQANNNKFYSEALDDTSYKCVVVKSESFDIEGVNLADIKQYIYGSPEDIEDGYDYCFAVVKGSLYEYNIDSLVGLFTNPPFCYTNVYEDENGNVDYSEWYLIIGKQVNYGGNDLFAQAEDLVTNATYWGENSLVYQVVCLILIIIMSIYLLMAVGHKSNDEEIHLNFIDKIPFEICTVVLAILESLAFLAYEFIYEIRPKDISQIIVLGIELALFIVFMGIAYIGTFIVRIKAKKFWRYTLVYYLCSPLRKIRNYARENLSLFWKTTLFIGTAFILLLISVGFFMAIGSLGLMLIWAFCVMVAVILGVYFIVFQMQRIKDGVQRIANGDVDHPIDTTKLVWEFKDHAENINTIGRGIDVAVQERMKSERFKTELITNVSHDIKTPLTSIINYVDLMKKEDITDKTLLEYMDVLDRQSARLKKLIEDLMEASKASTGNLTVKLEECDISVILGQAVGEFEEKMEQRELVPIITYPDKPINVSVDGRHLWRVFDNLLNNICKYAQSGTRVYINVEQKGNIVEIIFKNISSTQLNISSEELMERFVRGDSSRNTEGSGLGLSIAKSLTELMNGQLELSVDGDLFKVTLRFDSIYQQN